MKVSVVMPAYNVEKYVGEALDSLLAQTYTDWECIVVDDCSTDGTADIVKGYASRDGRIKYHKLEQNSGSVKVPRDRAIALAEGEWILYFDADDKIAPYMLQSQVERQSETGADWVGVRMIGMSEDGVVDANSVIPRRDFDMTQVLNGREAVMMTIGRWVISLAGALIRKELLDRWMQSSACDRGDVGIFVDENDSRGVLLFADVVAFADSPYFYRANSLSVSRKVSAGRFLGALTTYWALAGMMRGYFGEGSAEHRKAISVFLATLLRQHFRYAWSRHRLDKRGRRDVLESLRGHKAKVSRGRILSDEGLSAVKKIALMFPSRAIVVLAWMIPRRI